MLIFKSENFQKKYHLYVYQLIPSFTQDPSSFLSLDESTFFQQITNSRRQNEYLQSRYALKSLLSSRLKVAPAEIHLKKIGEGKPVLVDDSLSLDFNLSHTQDIFAIAISEQGLVGVDVEKERSPRHLERIAERFFSPPETRLIHQEQNPKRKIEIFMRFWSGKEALIKTMAGGVFKNVHDIVIDEHTWTIKKLPEGSGDLSTWSLDYYDAIPGYACSVGFKDSTPNR